MAKVKMIHPDLGDSPEFEVAAESVPAWESRGWTPVKQPKTKTKTTKTEEQG